MIDGREFSVREMSSFNMSYEGMRVVNCIMAASRVTSNIGSRIVTIAGFQNYTCSLKEITSFACIMS